MTDEQQNVSGLCCGEVLELLSDYLDMSITPDVKARIEEHLGDCNWCERFGGEYASTMTALRQNLATPEELGEDVALRLKEFLEAELKKL